MKKTMMAMAAVWMALSGSAIASEYKCASQGLAAYLVFDDGPGGLDFVSVQYQGKNYTEAGFSNDGALVDSSDSNTPDGKYEYEGLELAVQITGADKASFGFEASRPNLDTQALEGTVVITSPEGQASTSELRCWKL